MNTATDSQAVSARRRQAGFVLITSLLFLVILTLIGLSLFRTSGLLDRISANTRDKQRAFESAQSALQYGEWWLANSGVVPGTGSICNSVLNSNVSTNVHVCSNGLVNPATLPWSSGGNPVGFTYTPPNMTVQAGGGLNTGGVDINYQLAPGFYIEYEGFSSGGASQVYQVTAYGYGGNAGTASVVRSVYQLTSSVVAKDGL